MATFFEIRIAHPDAKYARGAAQAAFQVTAKLDRLLNRYREESEVSQIRVLPPGETLRVSPSTFSCLRIAAEMEQATGGAFDPILGEQVDAQRALLPSPGLVEEKGRLFLDPESMSVSVSRLGLALDLGAIGKGFALDEMAEELRVWEIERALLIAGESSILALDTPDPDSPGWEIALTKERILHLVHDSIGSSGTTVKGRHIIDPRTGQPADGPFRTWALHPSAAVSDALSTAWMLLEIDEIAEVCRAIPKTRAFIQELDVAEVQEVFV
jgi:thiamine biosynthesis lipoprotein